MKTAMLIAGILAAGLTAHARDPKPVDVTVYVNGDDWPPILVDYRARDTVTLMYARIGIRLSWRNDAPGSGAVYGSPVTIQVRFTGELPDASREALAYALPFGEQGVAIHVMYDRIRWVARRSSREAPILAHVLAHEIGHVLQRTNEHAPSGVMKAHWNGQDFDAMERKPLEFTSLDVDLIKDGLNLRKARSGGSTVVAAGAVLAATNWVQTDEWQSLILQASNLGQAGRLAEAASVYQEAVRVAGQPGQDATRAALTRNGLGMLYDELGRFAEAEHEYRQSLTLLEHAGALGTTDHARVLPDLAAHYVDLGRMAEAETLLRKSIAIFTSLVPKSDPGLALARRFLAVVMMQTGRYQEAEALLLQAVDALEKQPTPAWRLGIALSDLGQLRRYQARNQEAAELFRKALAILDRAVSPDHPHLLPLLNSLAFVENAMGRRDEAGALHRRALTIAEARLGTAHPSYGLILVDYAVFLRECGEKSRAKKLEAEGRAVLREFARANGIGLTVDASVLREAKGGMATTRQR
jgi:tetratricopeptide (TPR) repeat protein